MDKKLSFDKNDFADIVKSTLIAIVSCLILVLLFAVIIKFANLPNNVIVPINVVIKSLSVIFGIIIGVKQARIGALKGFLSSIMFVLITYLLFSIINQDWSVNTMMLIDSALLIAEGLISGIIVVNVKDKKAGR